MEKTTRGKKIKAIDEKTPPTHGGARAGSGRKPRDTVAITLRLHRATLEYLGPTYGRRSRSAQIERIILRDGRQRGMLSKRGKPELKAELNALVEYYIELSKIGCL